MAWILRDDVADPLKSDQQMVQKKFVHFRIDIFLVERRRRKEGCVIEDGRRLTTADFLLQ